MKLSFRFLDKRFLDKRFLDKSCLNIGLLNKMLNLIFLLGLLGPKYSVAQLTNVTTKTNNVKIKDKKATLNFEDELVEGSTQKPELFYLFQKKNFNYKKLIKLRENFLPELRKTSEDVQRVRGIN